MAVGHTRRTLFALPLIKLVSWRTDSAIQLVLIAVAVIISLVVEIWVRLGGEFYAELFVFRKQGLIRALLAGCRRVVVETIGDLLLVDNEGALEKRVHIVIGDAELTSIQSRMNEAIHHFTWLAGLQVSQEVLLIANQTSLLGFVHLAIRNKYRLALIVHQEISLLTLAALDAILVIETFVDEVLRTQSNTIVAQHIVVGLALDAGVDIGVVHTPNHSRGLEFTIVIFHIVRVHALGTAVAIDVLSEAIDIGSLFSRLAKSQFEGIKGIGNGQVVVCLTLNAVVGIVIDETIVYLGNLHAEFKSVIGTVVSDLLVERGFCDVGLIYVGVSQGLRVHIDWACQIDFRLREVSRVVARVALSALNHLGIANCHQRKLSAIADAVGHLVAELLVVLHDGQVAWSAADTYGLAVEKSGRVELEFEAIRYVVTPVDAFLVIKQKRLNALHTKVTVTDFLVLEAILYFRRKQANRLVVVRSHESHVALKALVVGLVDEAIVDADSQDSVFNLGTLHAGFLLKRKFDRNVTQVALLTPSSTEVHVDELILGSVRVVGHYRALIVPEKRLRQTVLDFHRVAVLLGHIRNVSCFADHAHEFVVHKDSLETELVVCIIA